MLIELLHTQNGPATQELKRSIQAVLDDLAPQEKITFIKIDTTGAKDHPDSATPTLRVDGTTIKPSGDQAGELPISTGQELQPGTITLPSENTIRAAVLHAVADSPVRLPLRDRRLILIGSLGALSGAVLGQFLLWGPAVTLTGLSILAVGLSSNGRARGFQPFMYVTDIAALVWVLSIIWSWWPVITETNESANPLSGPAFQVGLAGLTAVLLSVLAAWVTRMKLRRYLAAKTSLSTTPG